MTTTARLQPVDPAQANGKAKELLDDVQAKLGTTPNMMKTMAVSPAVLEGYLGLSGALARCSVGAATGERIALGVAELNECGYCLSAHTYIGKNLAKLSDHDVEDSRRLHAHDPKTDAALKFAKVLVESRGAVSDSDVQRVRDAGHSDAEIAEIVAHVALNVLTNYFNRTAAVEIDFPVVEPAGLAA